MTDEERTIDNIEITAEELAENADKLRTWQIK